MRAQGTGAGNYFVDLKASVQLFQHSLGFRVTISMVMVEVQKVYLAPSKR